LKSGLDGGGDQPARGRHRRMSRRKEEEEEEEMMMMMMMMMMRKRRRRRRRRRRSVYSSLRSKQTLWGTSIFPLRIIVVGW
jgi:hypothetical protein